MTVVGDPACVVDARISTCGGRGGGVFGVSPDPVGAVVIWVPLTPSVSERSADGIFMDTNRAPRPRSRARIPG